MLNKPTTCSIPGCNRPQKSLSYCAAHYGRYFRHGDPLAGRVTGLSLEQRFWSYVDKSGDCWVWVAGKYNSGYGCFYIGRLNDGTECRQILAHRFSYELYAGSIPDDMYVLHHCDNHSCVRPDHLFLGTHLDNLADMVIKGRHSRKLSDADIRAIRQLRLAGLSGPSIGKRFGIDHTQVYRICKFRSWAHVK